MAEKCHGISLQNNIAIVTGAARGIGLEICKVFCELGASVIGVDKNGKDLEKAITDLKQVRLDPRKGNLENVRSFGFRNTKPDILINCAGIPGDFHVGLMEEDEKSWDDLINTNLKSAFLMSQGFIRHFLKNRDVSSFSNHPVPSGRIVNVSSVRALGAFGTMLAYNASKSAIISLTKSIAKEWGPKQIRCNAVLPGYVQTPVRTAEQVAAKMAKIEKLNMLGRLCQPRDVAQSIAFLASDFSSFVTGTTLVVDGGECMMK